MTDPPLSDIDFKNKMAWLWTTLKKTASIYVKNYVHLVAPRIFVLTLVETLVITWNNSLCGFAFLSPSSPSSSSSPAINEMPG